MNAKLAFQLIRRIDAFRKSPRGRRAAERQAFRYIDKGAALGDIENIINKYQDRMIRTHSMRKLKKYMKKLTIHTDAAHLLATSEFLI